uniref:Uncharacterized protein n=1 Tax=Leersia perrieri TaxID=77586 RepID=A0A0D9WUY5_9ORYZ
MAAAAVAAAGSRLPCAGALMEKAAAAAAAKAASLPGAGAPMAAAAAAKAASLPGAGAPMAAAAKAASLPGAGLAKAAVKGLSSKPMMGSNIVASRALCSATASQKAEYLKVLKEHMQKLEATLPEEEFKSIMNNFLCDYHKAVPEVDLASFKFQLKRLEEQLMWKKTSALALFSSILGFLLGVPYMFYTWEKENVRRDFHLNSLEKRLCYLEEEGSGGHGKTCTEKGNKAARATPVEIIEKKTSAVSGNSVAAPGGNNTNAE